jgi:hypothetical protein
VSVTRLDNRRILRIRPKKPRKFTLPDGYYR